MFRDAACPNVLFQELTEAMYMGRKRYGLLLKCQLGEESPQTRMVFDKAFAGKTGAHFGMKDMPWREWLVWTVFPEQYWLENGRSLLRLLDDPRIYDDPHFGGKDAYNSFFGRMARRREGLPESFMSYTLKRFANKTDRALPHFYFDTESPEWVWNDLVKNPRLLKSWRTSVSCVMNINFRWDALKGYPIVTLVMKHCNWSHAYGDVFGGNALLKAFCHELELPPVGEVHIFMCSCSMDEPKIAREYLANIGDS
jgi:hypothetical protein